MNIATILARALLNMEELGELTVDLTQTERDAVEYAYNQAVSQDWHLAVVNEDGLALGATGVMNVNHNGSLVPLLMNEELDDVG